MEHPITHIGAPEGQNGLRHVAITFVFQWRIKDTPGNTDELTCRAFRNTDSNQEAGLRPEAVSHFFGTDSTFHQSTGLDPQRFA